MNKLQQNSCNPFALCINGPKQEDRGIHIILSQQIWATYIYILYIHFILATYIVHPFYFSHIFWKSICSMHEAVATYIENVISSVQERFKTAGEEHTFSHQTLFHMSWYILEPSECTHTDFNKILFKKICAEDSLVKSQGCQKIS